MSKISKKLVDGILKPSKHTRAAFERPMENIGKKSSPASVSFGQLGRFLLVSKFSLILLLMTFVVPMTAFEAHVVNVTATIERKQCAEYEVRSLGFWKTHSELWIFPQTLGPDSIATSTDAVAVFTASNSSMRNKLKKQLLALKFNIAYYGAGSALVPNEATTTLIDLAAQADALLSQDPPPGDTVLEAMKNAVESVNISKKVSDCPPPPPPPGGTCNKDDPPPHDPSHDPSSQKWDDEDNDNNNRDEKDEKYDGDKKSHDERDTSNGNKGDHGSSDGEYDRGDITATSTTGAEENSFMSTMVGSSTDTITTETVSSTTQSEASAAIDTNTISASSTPTEEVTTSIPVESTSIVPLVTQETNTETPTSDSPPPQDPTPDPSTSDASSVLTPTQ